ncbi:MAG: 30S ribosomal protein S1 [Anaerolineae bacterium]|nr:30S ribosomal protein S1 [Chloroflexota bacterium]MBP6298285.1 30S ribosomal protein S1 [Anaerolineae bacterium]
MSDTPSLADLQVGAQLSATVKAIELYGAFVDVGVGSDALLHISQLGKPNVRNVEDVVKVGDKLTVYVIKVEPETKRIAVSLVKPAKLNWDDIKEGATFDGQVVRVESYGAFIDIGAERPGMAHISELAEGFVKQASDVVKVGEKVQVRILKYNRKKKQIDLSLKPAEEAHVQMIEEDEEPQLTAMAAALQKAMRGDDGAAARMAATAKKAKQRAQQDDIIARTLRSHGNN